MAKDAVKIKAKRRMFFLFGGSIALFSLLAVRVAWIQTVDSEKLQREAYEIQTRDRTITSKRGTIYSSDGKILAISASVETVNVIPAQIGDPTEVAKKLSEILELNYDDTYGKITSKAALVTVKKDVEKDKTDLIRKWILEADIKGIKIDEATRRFYPNNSLASGVLGFVGTDNQGLYGIEKSYDGILTGVPGRVISETDGRGNDIPFNSEQYFAPQNGRDIVLSIDSSIQYFAEKYLEQAVIDNDCRKGGVAIVIKPSTGDILAMAIKPDYDLNEAFGPYTPEQQISWETIPSEEKVKIREEMWRNKAISDTYEPGSTFKIITSSAAIDSGVVSQDDKFTCVGHITVGGARIKCWRYYKPHGVQTLTEALGNSCNPVFVSIGLKTGKEVLYKYIDGFGLTEKTGIELPGEASGIFHRIQKVGEVELATTSFGQRFQITPMGMINAVSAVANDGKLMQPRIVKQISDSEGNILTDNAPIVIRQVISKQTADIVKAMMEKVVSEGTGGNAYIKGYDVGGKTGTAEQGIGASTWYVASFMGIAPINNPEVAVLVALFDPKGPSHGGGAIAAPVTKQIIDDTLRYLQIQPYIDRNDPANQGIIVPEVRGNKVKEAIAKVKSSGLKCNVQGQGETITDQIPKPNVEVIANSTIILYTEEGLEKIKVKVPNIIGKSVSDATDILKNIGLIINTNGLGFADNQYPSPGTDIDRGSIVNVEFKLVEVD